MTGAVCERGRQLLIRQVGSLIRSVHVEVRWDEFYGYYSLVTRQFWQW